MQPHLTQQQLQEMADALNGTPEKPVGCTAKPPSAINKNTGAPRFSLPSDSTVTIYADAKHGSDSNKGTLDSPVKSLHHAVELSRSAGVGNPRTVVLREGYYYLPQALSLTQEDSGLTVQNYNGEEADIAGAAPLSVDWSEYNVSSAAAAYYAEKHPELYAEPAWGAGGQWVESPDTDAMQYAAPNATSNQGHMGSAGDCEAACQANYTKAQKDGGIACTIWTYHNGGDCYFRTDNTWKPVQEYGQTSGRYLAAPAPAPSGQHLESQHLDRDHPPQRHHGNPSLWCQGSPREIPQQPESGAPGLRFPPDHQDMAGTGDSQEPRHPIRPIDPVPQQLRHVLDVQARRGRRVRTFHSRCGVLVQQRHCVSNVIFVILWGLNIDWRLGYRSCPCPSKGPFCAGQFIYNIFSCHAPCAPSSIAAAAVHSPTGCQRVSRQTRASCPTSRTRRPRVGSSRPGGKRRRGNMCICIAPWETDICFSPVLLCQSAPTAAPWRSRLQTPGLPVFASPGVLPL